MSGRRYEFVHPQRFIAGTVGEPGQRTFYLQAKDGARLTSVVLEKGQVAALAGRAAELLDTLLRRSGGQLPIPAIAPESQLDLQPLDTPVDAEFRVGTMSLAWDEANESVVVEAFAASDDDDDASYDEVGGRAEATAADEAGDETSVEALTAAMLAADEGRDVLRVVLSGVAARGFAERATRLVAAGRPPCPFCDLPLDPEGHICPRQNGYRRR